MARLRAGDETAWTEFIDAFAPLLLGVARTVERDPDHAADAFVHACERLRERQAARLGAFDFSRPGTFESWLRAVALNLCRDARRRRTGRFRPLLGIRRLPALEQRVFRLRYEIGVTFEQALASLVPEFPGLTERRLVEAESLVAAHLSSRDRWRVLSRRPRVESIDSAAFAAADEPSAPAETDPEWAAVARQSRERLGAALAALPPSDRVLIALRFERGVTLARLASMFQFRDVQSVDRHLRDVLRRLRRDVDGTAGGETRRAGP